MTRFLFRGLCSLSGRHRPNTSGSGTKSYTHIPVANQCTYRPYGGGCGQSTGRKAILLAESTICRAGRPSARTSCAELLAVAVLLVLAAVTGQTARALSANIDRHALADLALSDPLEVCINGAETLTRWVQNQGPLQLSPNFKWPNGTWYDPDPDYSDEKNASETGKEQALFEGHRNNTSLDDMTLSAMYRCGLVAGRARGMDFAGAIRNNAPVVWPNSLPDLEFRLNLVVDGRKYQVGLLTGNHQPLFSRYAVRLQAFLTVLGFNDSLVPLHGQNVPWQLQHPPTFDVSDASSPLYPGDANLQVYSYFGGTSWGVDASTRRLVPPLFVRFARIRHVITSSEVNFMKIAAQNASTAECMAHHSNVDADMLLRSYSVNTDSAGRLLYASDLNLSLAGLQVVPNAIEGLGDPYDCYGADVRSSNFPTVQSKLAAYKAHRKAMLTTTLFVSMVEQSYDDVYAVYTGILGALFGAFALLVTTLFVYLVAAVKRSFVC